jgi:hypothetical protein
MTRQAIRISKLAIGGIDKIVNLSINALKYIEVARSTVTPSKSLKLAEKLKIRSLS